MIKIDYFNYNRNRYFFLEIHNQSLQSSNFLFFDLNHLLVDYKIFMNFLFDFIKNKSTTLDDKSIYKIKK